MPSDEYASFGGGGALKLKGAKVKKHKKKKDKVSDLERALSTGETSSSPRAGGSAKPETEEPGREGEDGKEVVRSRDGSSHGEGGKEEEDEDQRDSAVSYKTEAERRFEEAKRKKLLELSESASARPELLKTHKERVEELNTYLSKLSEHHDMPKIGPG